MSEQPRPNPQEIDLPKLERSLRSPRTLFSVCMSVLTAALTVVAMVPLFSVLIMLLWRGGRRLSLGLFTELPPAAGMVGGGIANAILGTLLVNFAGELIIRRTSAGVAVVKGAAK